MDNDDHLRLQVLLRDSRSDSWSGYRGEKIALVLENSVQSRGKERSSGILVSIYGRNGNMTLARIQGNVVVGRALAEDLNQPIQRVSLFKSGVVAECELEKIRKLS